MGGRVLAAALGGGLLGPVAAGTNATAATAEGIIRGVDSTLLAVNRAIAAITLCLIAALCVGVPIILCRLRSSADGGGGGPLCRRHKLRDCFCRYCCCGYCCPSVHQSLGFERLMPKASSLLRITFICAKDIRRRLDFYFEAWSEPVEGYPKNTRIQQQAVGVCDLGCEELELDWFRDEKEVVILLVENKGQLQSRDEAIGEVRIPGREVEKYAWEASADPRDLSRGTRLFTLRGLDKHDQLKRKLRFKNAGGAVVQKILNKVHEEVLLDYPTRQEFERLQTENEMLRRQTGTMPADTADIPAPMSVAVRFEILPRRSVHQSDIFLFRTPSFEGTRQEEGMQANGRTLNFGYG
mmetsp:Transcript_83736/g.237502  ORF Transcript_83736/g.237502 Transcript_83736/m.237502 type:complete len:353 (+) Transcript_83736:126-1184(+)